MPLFDGKPEWDDEAILDDVIDTLAEMVSRELEVAEIRGDTDSEGEPLSVGLNLFVFVGVTEIDWVKLVDTVKVSDAVDVLEKDNNEDAVCVTKFEAVTESVPLTDCVPVNDVETHEDTVFVTEVEIHAEFVDVTVASDVTVKSGERVAVTDADKLTVADELLHTVSVAVERTVEDSVWNTDSVLIAVLVIVFTGVKVVENVASVVLDGEIEGENVTEGELDELEVLDTDAVGDEEAIDEFEGILVNVAVFDCDFVPLVVISLDTVVDAQKVGEEVPLPLAVIVPLTVSEANSDSDDDDDSTAVWVIVPIDDFEEVTQAVTRGDGDGVVELVDVIKIVNELDALLETLKITLSVIKALTLDELVVDTEFVDDAESVDVIVSEVNADTVKIGVSVVDCVAVIV
jgi:hypothetical protein